ncbi:MULTISPECIES: PRD domain-containing protein [unclassified Virgibacillus]|uniref:PRD domain-containing protein n=1 Tax=unclassified Virgibacillus TaxID=2620237 RepID=UPI00090C5E7B|nr:MULTISPECIES: PRD domain-containing protein [unclassified Virgibacillus]API91494.1 transcriptional antiterminator [Virgibacillus sp. 6R]MBS7426998.1 PRD domain-containing protein [Virgibacillus sp. 19R1-5]
MAVIKKILNNNAVLVRDENGEDFIWIGSGLGFQKRTGDVADPNKIEKKFVLQRKQMTEKFASLLENIPTQYVSLTDDIISYAKSEIPYELSDALYISLTDHIANTIRLYNDGIVNINELSWEVKKFYPKEFAVGNKAIELISEKTGIEFTEAEAGNIALHIINAEINSNIGQIENTAKTAKMIRDILSIVRFKNKVELNEESLAYDRFVTHLRFFFKRLDNRKETSVENMLLKQVKDKYHGAYETMKLIEKYLDIHLNEDEQLYLILHIEKLINRN